MLISGGGMRIVTFGDVRVALEQGVDVHIGVNATVDLVSRHMARASYEEQTYDTNSEATVTSTCLCSLAIEQYDELRALGASEDGLLA